MSSDPDTVSDEQARLTAALSASYTIERPLGHGGMATVYLARDLKHDRAVAIKVLRAELYSRSFAERFLAEITVTAGLQHPHILPLFDSGAVDELLYYVMPYVEDGTLRDRLRATPQLPIAEAVRIATEVAGALEHAHQQGVIHRDIKPENILLQDGSALVADFGIAFSIANGAGERLTGTGLAIGTPAYMSPEQASGERALDARSDVYALGAVVYEMLAGVTPHTGDSAAQLIARVLTTDPELLSTRRTDVSPPLSAVIAKALARRTDERWASAGALATALAAPPAAPSPVQLSGRRVRRWRGTAVLGVLAAAVVAAWWQRSRVSPPPIVTARRQVTFVGTVQQVSLSPDGRTLAYVALHDDSLSVYTQDLAGGNAVRLTTLANADVSSLEWSPDGTRLVLTAASGIVSMAQHVSALGGAGQPLPVQSLVPGMLAFSTWSADGRQVVLWGPRAVATLATVGVQTLDTASRAINGVGYLFGGQISRHSSRLIALHVPDESSDVVNLAIVPPKGSPSFIMATQVNDSILIMPQWGPQDDAIFALRASSELVRVPLRRDGLTPASSPQVLATGLEPWGSRIHFSMSALSLSADAKRVAYTRSSSYATIVLVAAGGAASRLTSNTTRKWSATLSPDGSRIAYLQYTAGSHADLWLLDVNTSATRQLTFDAQLVAADEVPLLAWSPSGDRLAAIVLDRGMTRVAVFDATGQSPPRVLQTGSPNHRSGLSWAPASRLAYEDVHFGAGVHLVDPATGRDSVILAGDSTVSRFRPVLGRDERSMAYYQTAGDSTRTGLYIAVEGETPRRIASQSLTPLGWSDDGQAVIAREVGTRNVVALSRTGAIRPLAQSVGRNDWCEWQRAPGNGRLVCTNVTSVSDAWVLDLQYPKR